MNGESERNFYFNERDVEILRLVWQHRFLRREQISALTGRHITKLNERLLKLCGRGYLKVLVFKPHKYIYSIWHEGIAALVEQGIAPPHLLGRRLRTHELSEWNLRHHEMLIVDIHVTLSLASRKGDIQLVDWREGEANWDSVQVGSEEIPVTPDGFFTLQDHRRPPESQLSHFFLEADRTKHNHTRFSQKIIGTAQYFKQGRHVPKFNIKGFRMLTVTLHEKRANGLSTLAQSLLPAGDLRKLFLFTSLQNFSVEKPETIFDPICFSPRDQDPNMRRPLMPAPPKPSVVPLQTESAVV